MWKDIENYEGIYQVSDSGEVRSLKTNRVLKASVNPHGYLFVNLYKDGRKPKHCLVHRLVANAFLPNPLNLPEVNHKNEVKTDNRTSNIEWMSSKENCNYGTRNRRISYGMTNGKLSKPVLQYSLDGTFIKEWESAREVERKTGYKQSNVSRCCCGEYKKAYNFIWKYKEVI